MATENAFQLEKHQVQQSDYAGITFDLIQQLQSNFNFLVLGMLIFMIIVKFPKLNMRKHDLAH